MKCTRRRRRLEGEPAAETKRAEPRATSRELRANRMPRSSWLAAYLLDNTKLARYRVGKWMVPSWLGPYNKVMRDSFIIAGRQFRSRLIVGTGKYKSFQETARALEASGADMVTVAVRRVNLDRSKESLLDYIDLNKYFVLPNTAGCYTADDTIRTARLAREVGLSDWIKLE